MKALHIAASGMMAQEMNVELISNNIANMRTTGFKRQRVDFQDLLYQDMRRVGTSTSESGNILPTGVQIGSGVRAAATPRIMSQGTLSSTEKETDVAIKGEGFFRILLPDGRTAYTRDGSFNIDSSGRIVTADGYTLDPTITVPSNGTGLTINSQGAVQVTVGNASSPSTIGQIQLARFVNKSGLDAIGNNLFLETASSGAPQVGTPGLNGLGVMLQNTLENSNVSVVEELVNMITTQRAYEMNSKVISTADQMLGFISQNL